MASSVCPWSFLSSSEMAPPVNLEKSFAQAVTAPCDSPMRCLPPKVRIGDKVHIKISQKVYEAEVEDCKNHLHGRVMLQKGDPPLISKILKQKLDSLWPHLKNWSVTPLGKGYFEFKFQSAEEMKKVWALGVINLKPGIMKFFCWSKDFDPLNQTQAHAQLWIRLMHLP